MGVCETKNMDMFNKVHVFEPMKVHTFGLNIRLTRLFSLMLNYAKPRMLPNLYNSISCNVPIFECIQQFSVKSNNLYYMCYKKSMHTYLGIAIETSGGISGQNHLR